MHRLKKKKCIHIQQNVIGQFSIRSNLKNSYARQEQPVPTTEFIVQATHDLGGLDEDPLPTLRHAGMSKPIDYKYNGTLFRSTITRPLLDPLIYHDHDYRHPRHALSQLQLKLLHISGLIKRYLLIKIRDMHRLANLLYFPIIDILLGALVWMWMERSNPNINRICTDYILCLIFWTITNAVQFETCFNFLEELQSRNLINLFSSALDHIDWLIASTILSIIEATMSITVCGIAAFISFGINVLSLGLLFPIFFLLFITNGWILAIFTTGLFLLFGQRATFLIWAIPYLILPLSAPWYPISVLPAWAQYIAYCLPTTYLFEGIHRLTFDGTLPIKYITISFILTATYAIITIIFFGKMFKKSKEKSLALLEQD